MTAPVGAAGHAALAGAATATAATGPSRKGDGIHQASKQLEAFFLRRLLSETRGDGTGMLDGGFAGDTFKDMLDGALSDQMASAGGVGLAAVIEKSMRQGGEDPTQVATAIDTLAPTRGPLPLARPTLYRGAGVPPAGPGPAAAVPPAAAPAVAGAYLKPAPGRYTSGFGSRIDPIDHTTSTHPGLDIAARTGTTVVAAAAGRVTHAGPAGTYGNLVIVKHPDGIETRYAHLSAVDVREGDEIAAGTDVGKVGATGRVTGPHLHFEVRVHGKAVDPRPYLEGAVDPADSIEKAPAPSTGSSTGR